MNEYLSKASQRKPLSREKEAELNEKRLAGCERARREMIEANLMFVVRIAKKYQGLGMDLEDLVAEGNIGLVQAVDRFDHTRGYKLITAACHVIRARILTALARRSSMIRMTTHARSMLGRIRKAEEETRAELGREPSDEEIAEASGIDADEVGYWRPFVVHIASLDSCPAGGHGSGMENLIADTEGKDPGAAAEESNDWEMVEQCMQTLDQRDRQILIRRYGLDGGDPMTLEEVGKEMGVTRERVRQIQQSAVCAMRRRLSHMERAESALPFGVAAG